jgi:hypothetical protein
MKHFYKSLFVALLLPIVSLAQSNYKPGYLVTLKGDTVKGYVDYREWSSNPTSINFKTAAPDSKVQKFSPEEIRFFAINGFEAYRQYTGPISTDIIDLDHIGSGKDTSFRTATVFLRVLEKGSKVALYMYTDDIKTRYYIGEAPDYSPKELEYRIYYDANNNTEVLGQQKGRTITENTYMKQLFALAEKYNVLNNDLQWQIEHAGYYTDDLLKLVSKINSISGKEYKKNYGNQTKLNLVVGVALNITSTKPGGIYQSVGGTSYTSYLPAVTFGLNFFANPNTGKLVFRMEASLAEGQYKSLYNNKVSPYIPIKYSYNQLAVAFTPQIIYSFYNKDSFKIYAGLGVGASFFNYSNATFGSQDGKTPVAQIEQNDPYAFFSYNTIVMIKAGVQFSKNWGVFANYLTPTAVTHDDYFDLNFSTLQVGVNYFFK